VLGNGREYLVDKIWTLAENLSCRGVSTAAFSANALVCSAINFDQGFETFIEVDERADGVNAELFAWLEERGPFQFFAYVHYMEPHSPYSAPGEFRQHFDSGYVERRDFSGPLPERWRLGKVEKAFTEDEAQHLVNLYDSEVYYWDREFRRLLEKLQALGYGDNTIVIVTADHGEEFFDHEGLGHGLTLYSEVVQVPLIVHNPRVKKGLRVSDRVSTGALFDTVSDLMGAKPYRGTQIKGLFPLNRLASRFERIYSSTESNMPDYAARWAGMFEGTWKVVTDVDGKADLLFDTAVDPGDRNDLFSEQPDEGRRLKSEVLEWYRRTADEFPDAYQPSIPELLEELERLGYTAGK
jgi:arylsulfatase A-like enzyme